MSNTKQYYRFGELPTDGQSRHKRDDSPLPGVSVMIATDAIGGKGQWSGMMLTTLMVGDIDHANLYIVEGDELAERGHDGECLITNAAIIREATDEEKRNLYADAWRYMKSDFPSREEYIEMMMQPRFAY